MSRHIDPLTENSRQAYLDALYLLSGRTDGLYTGLYQRRSEELIEADKKQLLQRPS